MKDLASRAFTTSLILAALLAMLFFSLTALKSGFALLGVPELLRIVGLLTFARIDLLLPLVLFFAALWTYGKSAASGELDAMRAAGASLIRLMGPVIIFGSLGFTFLSWAQDEAIPDSHYSRRLIGRRYLSASIERLLSEERIGIEDERFKCTARSAIDGDGHRILYDVVVSEMPKDGAEPRITRAQRAIPHLDPARAELTLVLQGLQRGSVLASEEMSITLNLGALAERRPPSRRPKDRSYDALYTLAERGQTSKELLGARAELYRRFAMAASALIFAVFGALFGVAKREWSRARSLGFGFLYVLGLGFAPTLLGEGLAVSGLVPAALALWSGNIFIMLVSLRTWFAIRRR